MKRTTRVAAVALALATALSSQAGHPMASSIPVRDVSLNAATHDALAALAKQYHVVIGVYRVFVGSDSHSVSISLRDGTLGEVFDAVVRADPRLEWKQASNGAVHFTSRESPLSLFDVTVSSFDAENPQAGETSDRLSRVPEVSAWLRDNRCALIEWIVGVGRPKEWDRFAVHSREAPLSAVLDEIASKSGTYFWSATQYSTQPCEISARFAGR